MMHELTKTFAIIMKSSTKFIQLNNEPQEIIEKKACEFPVSINKILQQWLALKKNAKHFTPKQRVLPVFYLVI